MVWPNWNGIPWKLGEMEKYRLKDSYTKLLTRLKNLKRNAKKKGIEVEEHPGFLDLANETFISHDLYPKLFPKIEISE